MWFSCRLWTKSDCRTGWVLVLYGGIVRQCTICLIHSIYMNISYPPLPSGTRIIYDRKFLLECRSSPLARTPPCSLPNIPGVTSPPSKHINNVKAHNREPLNNNITAPADKSTGKNMILSGRPTIYSYLRHYNVPKKKHPRKQSYEMY